MAELTKQKRAAIWAFDSKDGSVHKSDVYFIKALMPYLSKLIIVTTTSLTESAKQTLAAFSTDILMTADAHTPKAYQTGFEYLIKSENKTFDEILFFDRSLFGPFNQAGEMFKEMEKRDTDVWGLHWIYQHKIGTLEKQAYRKPTRTTIPDYLPWAMIAFRQSVIQSGALGRLLKHAGNIRKAPTAQYQLEIKSAGILRKCGYQMEAYLDTSGMRDYAYNPLLTAPYRALKALKTPYLYRKLFYMNLSETLEYTLGQTIKDTATFIDTQTDYDIDMLWDDIIQSGNQHDIKNALGLTFMLPSDHDIPQKRKENPSVALCMHLYYEDLFDACLTYAASMPQSADIVITTNSEAKKATLMEKLKKIPSKSYDVRVIGNRGRDVSALLIGCEDIIETYDIICFAHDKKTTQHTPNCIGETFAYQCFENILSTSHYVKNVIQTFIDNPRLGILSPPPPFHAELYSTIGREWVRNFDNTIALAKKLNITVPISEDKPPIAPLGTMFWFRGDALKMLCDDKMTYSDFPKEPNDVDGTILHAYERIYPYAAQQSGYFAGHCMSDTYAEIQMNAQYHMLREINYQVFNQIDLKYDTYNKMKSQIDKKVKKNLYLRLEHFVLTHFNEKIIRFLKAIFIRK